MIDRPRHSVDAPITKTLIALRRVKSLKDPSTNSMTKFAYLFDNEAWDTASSNRISMQFMDHSSPAICDRSLVQFQPEGVLGEVKRRSDAIELESHLGKSMLKVLESEEFHAMNRSDVPKREMKTDKLSYDCVSNSNDCYESESASDSESSNSANEDDELPARDCTPRVSLSRRKSKYMDGFRTTDLMSRAGTPSLSVNDVLSSHNTSLYANEGLRFTENNDGECGITCCWTRTPKLRELGDGEVHPLLSRDIHELTACDGWNRNQIACKQIQKSLDHKFEPKSFDELVGQNVVVKALVGAISTKRIASLYLFHGPRGTGKTSAARLFAASLNCLSLDEHKPCGRCQECVQFYCGRSSDVKEVDSARINRGPRIRSLVKDASNPSRTAKFKVFILDECHMLQDETWMTILNNLDRFPPDVLLVMITPDIDKLPLNTKV